MHAIQIPAIDLYFIYKIIRAGLQLFLLNTTENSNEIK